ncbi:hypothetical protein CK203_044471 [Vitis vinifera]|uniref:DUF642 domain-containing protein n=1 Tax=Vitis vinifera TaxID=29760 RepID=A0A438HB25_VITVI|nr:hypothetical protein CK203_044471 [Vitis vinifera]
MPVRLGNEASIKQKVKVVKGMYYSITFSAARTCAQEETLNVSVAPNSAANDWGMLPMQTMYSSNGWDSYAWGFQADDKEIAISIHNPGVAEDPACGPLIDSVALKALYPPRRTRANLLKNGNFEEGPYVLDDRVPQSGEIHRLRPLRRAGGQTGRRTRRRERRVPLTSVFTIPNRVYVLSFSVGDANNSCEGSMVVEAFAGLDTIKVPYESKGKGGFKRAKLRFKAISKRTRVMFLSTYYTTKNDNSGSLCGPVLDDVKLLSVRKARV